jgi:hypothetical protein
MKAVIKHAAMATAAGLLALILIYAACIVLLPIVSGDQIEGDKLYVNDWAYLFEGLMALAAGFLATLVASGILAAWLESSTPRRMALAAALDGFFITAVMVLVAMIGSVSGVLFGMSLPIMDKVSGIVTVQAWCCPGYIIFLMLGITLSGCGAPIFLAGRHVVRWAAKILKPPAHKGLHR